MQFFRTVDRHGYMRIEEYGGASITLFLHDGAADVIALFVPEAARRKGIAYHLIMAAEKEASSYGASSINASFLGSIEGMGGLFEKAGFAEPQPQIIEPDKSNVIKNS